MHSLSIPKSFVSMKQKDTVSGVECGSSVRNARLQAFSQNINVQGYLFSTKIENITVAR